jgi:hypothetical protein
MAKQVTGNYFYLNKSGEIIQDSHPGRDKKTGYPKPPHGVKDVKCWTEIKDELWYYPDGIVKTGSKAGEVEVIPFEEDDRLVQQLNKGLLYALWLKGEPEPFWRYAIEAEWKESWIEEWEKRASIGGIEWWRAELRAFLSVVKDLSEKSVEIGEITRETIVLIKERFPKKKDKVK